MDGLMNRAAAPALKVAVIGLVMLASGNVARGQSTKGFVLFSRSMALDIGVSANFGKFDKFDSDNEKATAEVNGTRTMRMRVGVNWRPGARHRS